MDIQSRILKRIVFFNWFFFILIIIGSYIFTEVMFVKGVIYGGLIVVINFYVLAKTLLTAFRPGNLVSYNIILLKYYIRFIISGLIIFLLIWRQFVNPLGLVLGLSTVVASILFSIMIELKRIFFKEAV